MAEREIRLQGDLVERLEALAQAQGLSVNDLLETIFPPQRSQAPGNWAYELAIAMEEADIDWQIEPNLSENSRATSQPK